MKIYITGDIHGTLEIERLSFKRFPEGKNLTKEDYVIICGDFGLIWDGGAQDNWWLEWLNNKPWTTLFVDGNHENFNLLNSYPIEEWNGGKVHKIRSSIIHLMRGQVFNLNDIKIFSMGGAHSHDKWCRKEGVSWWGEEVPSSNEKWEGILNLEKHNNKVNIVLSHCGPAQLLPFINRSFEKDDITSYLDYIMDNIEYDKWFFGHYHQDINMGKEECLFNSIIELEVKKNGA